MPRTPITPATLRQLSGTWVAGFGFAAFLTWSVQGLLGQEGRTPLVLALTGAMAVAALLIASLFTFEEPSTARGWAICMGALTAPPLFFLLGYPGLVYFLFVDQPPDVQVVQWMCLLLAGVVWVGRDVADLRQTLHGDRLLERALTYSGGAAYLPWDSKLDLVAVKRGAMGSSWLRHGDKLVAITVPLAFAAHAINRAIEGSIGVKGVLLALTVLGLPLLLIMASKLARATYLYVFALDKIEKQTGSPVRFSGQQSGA